MGERLLQSGLSQWHHRPHCLVVPKDAGVEVWVFLHSTAWHEKPQMFAWPSHGSGGAKRAAAVWCVVVGQTMPWGLACPPPWGSESAGLPAPGDFQ